MLAEMYMHALRTVVRLRKENRELRDVIERQQIWIAESRRAAGLAPHDFEPARPGIREVD